MKRAANIERSWLNDNYENDKFARSESSRPWEWKISRRAIFLLNLAYRLENGALNS